MSKHRFWPWLLMLFIGLLPVFALLLAGFYWIWQQHWFWLWLNLSLSCTGIVWILTRRWKRQQAKPQARHTPKPNIAFSQRDEAAWLAVEAHMPNISQASRDKLDQLDTWLQIAQSVLTLVARHYRPKANHPEMDIPVTDLLRITELVSHDLHQQLHDHLPFSHVLTLEDGLNLQRWLDHLSAADTALRLGRVILNPFAGLLSEAKNYAQGKVVAASLPHLQDWLLELYIQKVGHYAIMLYSGRMAVAEEKRDLLSGKSRIDAKLAQHEQDLQQEPLRILVAGQTNAGKSTLINSLFDSPRAAADVLSCTSAIVPYHLQCEGQFTGLIFDTPGYGEQNSWLEENRQELDKTDLVLLLCHANNAARQADREFLQRFLQHFVAQAQRKIPPIILVLTHIDEVRPIREWQPPYDVEQPNCEKAVNIRAAMDAVLHDLNLPEDVAIVPVSLADNQGMGVYNLDSLWLAMGQHRDAAHQARLLRCLKEGENREKWQQLWRQVSNSGRWILRQTKV